MIQRKKYLIVIGGPTAIGKTDIAIRIATRFGIEILSADSRQFYSEMNIGTAKPSPEELLKSPHHFINNLSIHDNYSVGDYEQAVLKKLDELYQHDDMAILVGGSGLYIRAVCEGLDEFPDVPKEIQQNFEHFYQETGIIALQEKLKIADPNYYQKVDLQNPHRLIRALSVFEASGQPYSSFLKQSSGTRNFEPIYILPEMERPVLYERINQRVDKMMETGLLEEVKILHPLRYLNALQTVGYEELFDYLEGKTDLSTAVELIKRNTRRYAKRQLTWFRKDAHWQRFPATDIENMIVFLTRIFTNEHELFP